MPEPSREQTAKRFLNLVRESRRGKLKIYIGMAAGVGKTYRMLQEAHSLLRNGIDVQVGYIETHGRSETEAQLCGLPVIPRRSAFYKGKRLDELDLQAVINLHPEVVLIDELAHANIPGSRNDRRWQDVIEVLEAGISVISAVNIQHIESLNGVVREITGVEVRERVPDKILKLADEIVNIDLSADDLIARLKEGKIYAAENVQMALRNFFRPESILQLRELALREVAGQIEHKVETQLPKGAAYRHEHILTCIGTNPHVALKLIRKSARLTAYYNARWTVLHVETPGERADRIPPERQRQLLNTFRLATELGAKVERVEADSVARCIAAFAEEHDITMACIGKPRLSLPGIILSTSIFNSLLKRLAATDTDLIILS